jgi:hypothetical protein
MTLCPIALAVGCEKCPALSICPLKSILGNAPKKAEPRAGQTKTGAGRAGKRGRSAPSAVRRQGRRTVPSPTR